MKPALIVAIALLAVACSPTAVDVADSTTSLPVSSTTSQTAGTDASQGTTAATSVEPATSLVPTTTLGSTITTSLPVFPSQKESFEHGGEAWAVYLAIADEFDDPSLSRAVSLAEEHGYWAATGDLGCDAGGAEATGVEPSGTWVAVGVYFDSEGKAMGFVNALVARGHPVVGFGPIRSYCLD